VTASRILELAEMRLGLLVRTQEIKGSTYDGRTNDLMMCLEKGSAQGEHIHSRTVVCGRASSECEQEHQE
jgi:hypothetical protein